jgi:signal transduction histidine kinase
MNVPVSERILVRTPTGDDASLIAQILREQYDAIVADDLGALMRGFEEGAGAVIIASEALNDADCCTSLRQVLDRQETWSEIPILVFGAGEDHEREHVSELLGDRAQLLILERPLAIATFLSAIEAALRSRRRQYQVKRLLDELAASADAVKRAHQEADRAKDEFLATLAHELRSPMTAIRGWIQLLKMGGLDPADETKALTMIEQSTRVQAHIIEDLMDVSRILAGKPLIEPAVIELSPVVTNVVATFRPAADKQGIRLTSEIPVEPVMAFADEIRLQQVGWNLISNAIKFTPPGGSVDVTLSCEDSKAVLRVRDSGQGISPALLPHVFERYRQEEGQAKGSQRGLGLGLAIVRHIVEGHGGTIEAFSDGAGKGSEFVVTLPLREK